MKMIFFARVVLWVSSTCLALGVSSAAAAPYSGIPVRRDNLVSVVYSTELNSVMSLVTPQRTDHHGILDEKPPDFQLFS